MRRHSVIPAQVGIQSKLFPPEADPPLEGHWAYSVFVGRVP